MQFARYEAQCPLPHYGLDALVHIPSRIFPRLWLSARSTAVDPTQLATLNVTHIVSVIERQPQFPRMHPFPTTVHYALQDSEDADILKHLGSATAFIRAALNDPHSVVLVHCEKGISRAPTIVCAYLVAAFGYTPQHALEYVVARREIVAPTRSFLRQLATYAARLWQCSPVPNALSPPPASASAAPKAAAAPKPAQPKPVPACTMRFWCPKKEPASVPPPAPAPAPESARARARVWFQLLDEEPAPVPQPEPAAAQAGPSQTSPVPAPSDQDHDPFCAWALRSDLGLTAVDRLTSTRVEETDWSLVSVERYRWFREG